MEEPEFVHLKPNYFGLSPEDDSLCGKIIPSEAANVTWFVKSIGLNYLYTYLLVKRASDSKSKSNDVSVRIAG